MSYASHSCVPHPPALLLPSSLHSVTNDERIFSLLFLSRVFFFYWLIFWTAQKGRSTRIVVFAGSFWTAQKGRSIRIIVIFVSSLLDCAKGKEQKNGSFLLLAHFWTAQKGRSIRIIVFAGSFWTAQKGSSIRIIVIFVSSFLDCTKGKEHKNYSYFC